MATDMVGEEKTVGFAKLKGKEFDFYIQKYTITLGRRSKSSNVDIALGDNMNLSRHHASIAYNFESGRWELVVHGKNGVTANEKFIAPGHEPHKLTSKERLQVGDVAFYFLLPPSNKIKLKTGGQSRPRPSGGESASKKVRIAA
mmetsp:Transcript_33367/g.55997  ORF Transcript_33367/g.55997 Transcript_33367/m.55997 type:complete len:144 (-) Transcript_33367:281-712(-)|eukprot:CAMPEP_0198212572 /NCGR_PEP_ID=MMETSP1445-20131203/26649_1 /TAXON_ID=36898 /ORGANISM="Pyramimonas sp., Strain CCMP2087" /LENGTH=143 /DNA_ID=CAMNT_0043887049 /DNA_START=243 /DNA_END=674 /DNA_ORIENTATION=+